MARGDALLPIADPDVRRRGRPYVTMGLVGLSALVFLATFFQEPLARYALFYRYGLLPAELSQGIEVNRLLVGDLVVDISSPLTAWGKVFSSMFIHGGFMHFVGNMVYLWVFGGSLESRMGHVTFLIFYLACGVAAAWTHVALNMESTVPTVGASGAIAGVLGSYLLLFPYSRVVTLVFYFFVTAIRVPAVYLLGFWFLLQFFSGVGSLGAVAQTTGVAYWAHIGGFVAGVLAVAGYRLLRRQPVWQPYGHITWRWSRD
ncbi:MAG: rhomboid family intramembrane serine protease [Dehalococcoidia bacterium]